MGRGGLVNNVLDRRSFLKVIGATLGAAALSSFEALPVEADRDGRLDDLVLHEADIVHGKYISAMKSMIASVAGHRPYLEYGNVISFEPTYPWTPEKEQILRDVVRKNAQDSIHIIEAGGVEIVGWEESYKPIWQCNPAGMIIRVGLWRALGEVKR